MKNIGISLINIDQSVEANAELKLSDSIGKSMKDFFQHVEEELATGETAYLEIRGVEKEPVIFSIEKFDWL
jgi:hypothetical protein